MKKMEFDDKARVTAEAWMLVRESDVWDEIVQYGDLGFPLAYAHIAELADVSDDGKKLVLDIYDIIVKSLEIPEDDYYEDFEAMLDVRIAMQDESE